jgi:hypothetical protein
MPTPSPVTWSAFDLPVMRFYCKEGVICAHRLDLVWALGTACFNVVLVVAVDLTTCRRQRLWGAYPALLPCICSGHRSDRLLMSEPSQI